MGVPAMATADDQAEVAQDAWLEALFREHYRAVVRWTRAFGVPAASAEDVAQQVFLIAGRRRDDAMAVERPTALLFGIARRVAANARRGLRREAARRERADPPTAFVEPEHAVAQKQAAALLQSLLDRLSARHREVFVLSELEGMSAPEVATILDVDPPTVHARLRTARKHMTRWIAQQRARAQRSHP